ncbi:MAG: cytidylate kinase-like family protein [Clostridiales bacterium]|nr:cytidylate kinase-like family protein [Clostridiales bacterium]
MKIVTIGREFGSGGREIGRRVAEALHYDYYDSEIISNIAKHTELAEEYVRKVVDHEAHQLYPITIARTMGSHTPSLQMSIDIYKAQYDVIQAMADKSNCVIVGRCADYILRDCSPFKIFVCATMEERVRRCKERNPNQYRNDREWRRAIERVDVSRARYYEFFTNATWGDKLHYDVCLNTSNCNIKEVSQKLADLAELVLSDRA